jgi:hypothetical protein
MDRSQPDVPTEPSSDHAEPHRDPDRHEQWSADRGRLLTIAGYAEALVEAVHRIDRAYEEAAAVLAGARREAASIRADAEREAEHMTARAREELARLEFQITRLESTRRLKAEGAAGAVPDVVTLVEHKSDATRQIHRTEPAFDTPPVTDSESSSLTNAAEDEPDESESVEDNVSTQVRSIRRLLQERADRREPEIAPPQRRVPVRAAFAAVAAVLALGAGAWWFGGERNGDSTRLASARQTAPTREADPRPVSAGPPAAQPVDSAPAAPEPVKISVAVKAARSTWVRTGSDGVLDRGRIMAAGQQQLITGEREVEVRTGDGGALLVSVNGGPETALGKNGVDVVKRFALAEHGGASDASAGAPTPPKQNDAVERTSVATSGTTDPPADPSRSVRDEIADADTRWFNARYSGADAVLRTLQARDFELLDQRHAGERPETGAGVERRIQSLQIDTWADHAAASGVMIEHVGGRTPQDIMSVFAETWVKRDGRWQLLGLRLTTPGGTAAAR